jgi:UDP-N-acetylglucosamine 2-epimerase
LLQIVEALDWIAATVCPVLWPVHPRTHKRIREMGWAVSAVTTTDPLSYPDMLLLEGRARFVLTDYGGFKRKPTSCGSVHHTAMRPNGRKPARITATCLQDVPRNASWKPQPPPAKPVLGARAATVS